MQRRSKLFRSEQHVDVTTATHSADKTSACDEEYDPFAEEYGYEEDVPSWLTPALPSSSVQNSSVKSVVAPTTSIESDGDTNLADSTEQTLSTVPDTSSYTAASHEPLIIVVNDDGSAGTAASSKVSIGQPTTPEQKELWKSCHTLTRRHLKFYLANGMCLTCLVHYGTTGSIQTSQDMEKLSKKLAQKIYEKELPRGTKILSGQNSLRAKKYIDLYFSKHTSYHSR